MSHDSSGRDRRRLRNILLEPKLQLRYGMHFFVFGALAVLFVQWVSYRAIIEVVGRILEQAGQGDTLGPIVRESIGIAMLQSGWMLPLIGGAALFYAARLFHRFIGPQVPIRRQLRKLGEGDYSETCTIRESDELRELTAEVNRLTERLREREERPAGDTAEPRPRLRSVGEDGFSLIEVLAVMAVISVLGMLSVSQFVRAYDRARQRGTIADMRSIASANGTYEIDNGGAAPTLTDLEPYYLNPVAPVDRWGAAWEYEGPNPAYELRSLGSDSIAGPAPPEPWADEPYECDLVLRGGVFVQAPNSGT